MKTIISCKMKNLRENIRDAQFAQRMTSIQQDIPQKNIDVEILDGIINCIIHKTVEPQKMLITAKFN